MHTAGNASILSGHRVASTRGSGFIVQVEPAGSVPVETRVPLKYICFPALPPHRRDAMPSNGSGVFWKTSSVSGAAAGAMRHW